ncbi:hypothetical protein NFI96_006981, partial [Prochilodus magdalenae]
MSGVVSPDGVHCEELTQPSSIVVHPGQSLTIDCKVSYSVRSYATAWIRQPAGKALEYIGYISNGVHSQVVLTQSEGSVTVAPGGSYKLTCACSGLNPGDSWMYWIRQAPGKGLEWIMYYYTGSSKSTA